MEIDLRLKILSGEALQSRDSMYLKLPRKHKQAREEGLSDWFHTMLNRLEVRRSLEKGVHDELFRAKLELAAANADHAGQLFQQSKVRPHPKNYSNIRLWIEKLEQEHVVVAPVSHATFVAVHSEVAMSQRNLEEWARSLLCSPPAGTDTNAIAFDIESPALWQIKALVTVYDEDDLDQIAENGDSSSGPDENEGFKQRSLRAWYGELSGFVLSVWCGDSLMGLLRENLETASRATQCWLDVTSNFEKWEHSCHKNLQEAVGLTRDFAIAVLVVTGKTPLTQHTYQKFMQCFVNPKFRNESLRLMASIVRKNSL